MNIEATNSIKKFECLACFSSFEERQAQDLICPEGHFFCSNKECAKTYLDLIFSEPHNYYPGKCPMCKNIFDESHLKTLMNETQTNVYSELADKFGENATNSQIKTITEMISDLELTSPEKKKEDLRKIVMEVIERESQVFCPECLIGGRKDLECTHITCSNCDIRYCYVCGKKESDLNKSDEDGDIFGHNDDWMTQEQRCPMYFREIFEYDSRYSGQEEDAMNFFHLLKIQKALKELFQHLDIKDIKDMEDQYNLLKSYNLNIQAIMEKDITLIMKELSS